MKRKFAFIGFSYMAGILTAFLLGRIAVTAAVIILTGTALLLKDSRTAAAVCCVSLLLGAANLTLHEHIFDRIAALDGETVSVTGRVYSADTGSKGQTSLTVRGKINGKYSAGVRLISDSVSARAGDIITFKGTAAAPGDSYLYSSRLTAKTKGIYLNFYSAYEYSVKSTGFSVLRCADDFKSSITNNIDNCMPKDEGALMTAMLLGDKDMLSDKMRGMLSRSGCGHIMAVSGIHMTVIYTFLAAVFGRLFGKKGAYLLSMAALAMFCLTAGLSVSSVRAYIMLLVSGGAALFRREGDTLNSLGLAGLIITGISPFAAADVGLLLSFAGVFGIGVVSPMADKYFEMTLLDLKMKAPAMPTNIGSSFVGALCAFGATFPLSLIFFDEVSLLSPVANTFLIPICSAALTLGAAAAIMSGVPFVVKPLLTLSSLLCRVTLFCAEKLSELKLLIIPTGNNVMRYAAAAMAVLILAAFTVYICDRAKRRPKDEEKLLANRRTGGGMSVILSALLITAAVYGCSVSSDRSTLKTAVIIDSSGGAVIVRKGRSAAVVDIGNGGSYADKYLRRSGVTDIELLVTDNAEYGDILGLYDMGQIVTAADSGYYDCGFSALQIYGNGDIILHTMAQDILITDNTENIRQGGCTVITDKKKHTVDREGILFAKNKDKINAPDAAVYDNCCAEMFEEGNFIKMIMLFEGKSK